MLPAKLRAILETLPKIAIAFSGGLDSRFLSLAAQICGCEIILLNGGGPHISPHDTAWAKKWASANAFSIFFLRWDPLDLPGVSTNSRKRCYACKHSLLLEMKTTIANFGPDWRLCDGTNQDDTKVWRPGLQALQEAGAISPLMEAGMGKKEIREIGRKIGLDFWQQSARPCLLTRLNYGLKPEASRLALVAACEEEIEGKCKDLGDFRLRLLPEPVLHYTGHKSPELQAILERYGFKNIRIQKLAAISGFFDKNPLVNNFAAPA